MKVNVDDTLVEGETTDGDNLTATLPPRLVSVKVSTSLPDRNHPQVGSVASVAFEAGTINGEPFEAGVNDGTIVTVNEGEEQGNFKIGVKFDDGVYDEYNYPNEDINLKDMTTSLQFLN